MATRERPGDRGSREARDACDLVRREIREARLQLAMSLEAVGARAGMSPAQAGRLERGQVAHPTFDQVFRLARAVGLKPFATLYPDDVTVRDTPQLRVFDRLAAMAAPPLRIDREVVLPIPGDRRAWDGRIHGGGRCASVEVETHLRDAQATARRIARKQRDDPDAGPVLLVLARTAHNRRVLAEHREALRAQFPLDGAVIARDLRAGRVPLAGGVILV
jgi:transcriptional regulator with XRE-family HTH domain